jgi:AraC-like DNA-binding protein
MVLSRPSPRLREHVTGYAGLQVEAARPLEGRVVPTGGVTLYIDFLASVRSVTAPVSDPPLQIRASHVSGMWDGPVMFRQNTGHFGIAVGLTPQGAHALFAVPMRELANSLAGLDDLIGHRAGLLAERLWHAPDWEARFALLDRLLPPLLASGPAPAPVVTQACRRLSETSGSMSIGALAGELGTSRRYLEMRFSEQVGLPPKTVARIARFRRALNQLIGRTRRPLALVASGCGYSDQAHFSREFRSLAGCTPAAFRAERSAANTSTAIG